MSANTTTCSSKLFIGIDIHNLTRSLAGELLEDTDFYLIRGQNQTHTLTG